MTLTDQKLASFGPSPAWTRARISACFDRSLSLPRSWTQPSMPILCCMHQAPLLFSTLTLDMLLVEELLRRSSLPFCVTPLMSSTWMLLVFFLLFKWTMLVDIMFPWVSLLALVGQNIVWHFWTLLHEMFLHAYFNAFAWPQDLHSWIFPLEYYSSASRSHS